MTIVGLGFGCIENSVMTIGSNFIMMFILGISMGHVGYGFIMGWLYGKMLNTNKKRYGVLAFVIPWLLHGFYDFGLADGIEKINEFIPMSSLILEVVCIIFVFVIIKFVKKRRNDKDFNKPLKK